MKRTIKKTVALLLTVMFTLTATAALVPAFADNNAAAELALREDALKQLADSTVTNAKESNADKKGGADDDEIITIIVKVEGEPLLAVSDASDARAEVITQLMLANQRAVEKQINTVNGAEIDVLFNYTMLFNGFSFKGKAGLIDEILNIKGVEDCYRSMSWSLPEAVDEGGEPTKVATSAGVINADDMWSAGYIGTGTAIAVIDTGIKIDHTNFATAPSGARYTTDAIQSVISANNLHCEELYSGTLTAQTLYYSAKIPFRFNYVTGTNNVAHSTAGSDHGTHVSSIAAGNDSTVKGIAYNAQIITMQVFDNGDGEWSVILAALEDAACLAVDCVNMSLGSPCGFTTGAEDYERAFTLLYNAGVNLSVSAGNSGTISDGNAFSGYQLASNPDNGIVGEPSTLYGSMSVAACDNNLAGAVAYFSSWGTTSDLCLKPEIMAPGVSIYAATDPSYSYSSYGTKSGTSMSAPEIAGCVALVSQYVKATYPTLSQTQRMELVNTLLLSTARPRMSSGTLPYSPRVQGAGLVDVNAAMTTPVYVEVEGNDRPQLEIGDDPEYTGQFTLRFELVNRTNTAVSYTVSANVQTENAGTRTINGTSTYVMGEAPYSLTANSVIGGDTRVTVPANGRKTVTVTIDMSSYASFLNERFPNGIYVEGYVTLSGGVNLSVPYLGFYGDWDAPSVIDRTFYWDIIAGGVSWSSHALPNVAGSSTASGSYLELGANPYIQTNNFLADRISISPNGDGKYDAVDVIYTGLLRNCRSLTYTVSNADTDEVLKQEVYNYIWKGVNVDAGYLPAGAYDDYAVFTGWDGGALNNGDTAIITIDAALDHEGFNPAANECASWSFPVTVDTAPPEFVYWRIENNTLLLYATDAHYLAYVGVYSNSSYTTKIAEQAVTETSRGALSMLSFSIGSASTVYVQLADYACNTNRMALSGEGGSLEPIELAGVSIDSSAVTVYEGSTQLVNLIRNPADANNFSVEWTTDNAAIATVRGNISNAAVTGVMEGRTTLRVTATDRSTGVAYTASAAVTVLDYPSISEAINAAGTNIAFTTAGTYQWVIDMSETGRISAKSSNAGNSDTTCTVESASAALSAGDTVTFDWRVSSESNYDFLTFYVNGAMVSRISGTSSSNWAKYTYNVTADGSYTFRWVYSKDVSVDNGSDTGWIDEFSIVRAFIMGDVNGDGQVTSADALLVIRYALGTTTLTDEQRLHADVNGDGKIDNTDALLIMRLALGIIGSL